MTERLSPNSIKSSPKKALFYAMCVEFPNKTRLENTLTSAYQVIVGILSQIELEDHTEDDLIYLF